MMKLNFEKLVCIFASCCVVGFCVESVWCVIKNGHLESRQSLVYGPLSVAYGMGGVLLTLVLSKFSDAQLWKIFLLSFVVGSAAEYICSLGQEIVFGSVAWDYSHLPLNINGRVCLLYSLFWGVLGVFWVKVFMPITEKIIGSLNTTALSAFVWAFSIFFLFDAVMSAGAAVRMNRRDEGVPASSHIDVFFDEHFDDERMHKIYANSKKVEK